MISKLEESVVKLCYMRMRKVKVQVKAHAILLITNNNILLKTFATP